MQAIVNTDTMQLRVILPDDTEVTVCEDHVSYTRGGINDMGRWNTAIIQVNDTVPPGMSKEDVQGFRPNVWYFDASNERFVRP